MPFHASMEPGHEDREYEDVTALLDEIKKPQWSPVMKTGNTTRRLDRRTGARSCLNGARS